jgi:signal transduction histidine kinase
MILNELLDREKNQGSASQDDAVNILVVDDLPEKLFALETALDALGENIVTARSGPETLRSLLDRDFAVILLDVNMPELDGFETAQMIRRHPRFARTPIIFITAYVDELLAAKAYSLGAVDYILSPVVPEILRTKVGVFVDLFRKTEQVKRHAAETVALAKEQAARASAEEANRRKDEFLAVLSHELRNPLAPMRNALEILSSGTLEQPDLREAREVLLRQFQLLSRMVDDLLDVFKITYRKIRLAKGPVYLARLIRLMACDHRCGLQAEHVELIYDLPEEPVFVLGDRVRLAQIFANVLHNAAKFTKAGDTVTIRLTRDLPRQRAIVSIIDTGIGIAPEHLAHIFDSFGQVDQGLDRSRGGLGLGLTLVRGFVELHGGEIQVSSPGLGKGTQMTISLPMARKQEFQKEADALPPASQLSKKLRVLVVEDNQDTARTLNVLLARSGHDVILAYTGVNAITTAKEWRPDVVLCDLGLPQMDGYEVAQALRGDSGTAGVRLIAVSGYGQGRGSHQEHLGRIRHASDQAC